MYVYERAVRNFKEFFSVSITRNLIRDAETYDDVYVHGERTGDIILYTHTRINLLNNSIREHTMIYAHRPRIPDSSRARMKSVIDNVNVRGFVRRNLSFPSNISSLSKLARLHYSLILIIYALCYFSSLIRPRPIFS